MVALSLGNKLTVVNGVITPTHDVHEVDAVETEQLIITQINVPSPNFCGQLILYSLSGIFFLTGGNIAKGENGRANEITILVYNPITQLWYFNR